MIYWMLASLFALGLGLGGALTLYFTREPADAEAKRFEAFAEKWYGPSDFTQWESELAQEHH